MKLELSTLREEITKENTDTNKIGISMQKVSDNWENRKDTLAYYIEHDEIEKVETHLTILESDIEVEDYDHALGELDTCSFVLEHIQDKESLKLKNIF